MLPFWFGTIAGVAPWVAVLTTLGSRIADVIREAAVAENQRSTPGTAPLRPTILTIGDRPCGELDEAHDLVQRAIRMTRRLDRDPELGVLLGMEAISSTRAFGEPVLPEIQADVDGSPRDYPDLTGEFEVAEYRPAEFAVSVASDGARALFMTQRDVRLLPMKLEACETLLKPGSGLRVVLVGLAVAYPFYFMVTSAFKDLLEATKSPPDIGLGLLASRPELRHETLDRGSRSVAHSGSVARQGWRAGRRGRRRGRRRRRRRRRA